MAKAKAKQKTKAMKAKTGKRMPKIAASAQQQHPRVAWENLRGGILLADAVAHAKLAGPREVTAHHHAGELG